MVESLKDLEKLLKLSRKQGVTELNLGTISFKLGELPKAVSHSEEIEEVEDEFVQAIHAPLAHEEMAFFANGGNPEENPYRPMGDS